MLQQSKELRSYPPVTEVETVQDLIDFLTEKVSRYPSYRKEELFIEQKGKYYQLLTAKVTDDTFILGMDSRQSKPFSHEE